jgi:cytochrome c biogenesis factor
MINPLVMWIWLGGLIITFGALITIIPSRSGTTPTTPTLDLAAREPVGSVH